MSDEPRLVKRLVVEIFEDGSRTIDSWGFLGPKPTVVFASSLNHPFPMVTSTQSQTSAEYGEILAGILDTVINAADKNGKYNGN